MAFPPPRPTPASSTSRGCWASQRGSTAATTFRMPLVYPQAVLATGAVLLTLQCLAQVLRLLRGESMATGPGLE